MDSIKAESLGKSLLNKGEWLRTLPGFQKDLFVANFGTKQARRCLGKTGICIGLPAGVVAGGGVGDGNAAADRLGPPVASGAHIATLCVFLPLTGKGCGLYPIGGHAIQAGTALTIPKAKCAVL